MEIMSVSNNTAKDVFELISTKNPVFNTYIIWTSVLIIKMMLMSLFTAAQRFRTKVSHSLFVC